MFRENNTYKDIKKIDKKVLIDYCNENKLNFDLSEHSGEWGAFAHYIGDTEYNLSGYTLISFTNVISICLAQVVLENISEKYIKEYKILNKVFPKIESLNTVEDISDSEKNILLYNYIKDIYLADNFYEEYELLAKRYTIRLSLNDLEILDSIPKDNINQKIRYLIHKD